MFIFLMNCVETWSSNNHITDTHIHLILLNVFVHFHVLLMSQKYVNVWIFCFTKKLYSVPVNFIWITRAQLWFSESLKHFPARLLRESKSLPASKSRRPSLRTPLGARLDSRTNLRYVKGTFRVRKYNHF